MGKTSKRTYIRKLRDEYKLPHSYTQSAVNLYRCNKCSTEYESYARNPRTECPTCHGQTNDRPTDQDKRIRKILTGMLYRTTNKNHKYYNKYGGKGVRVCKEWSSYDNFRKWSLANGYGDKLTIDRIDSNGNYEPSNCEWISSEENTRRMAIRENFGKNKSIKLSSAMVETIREEYSTGVFSRVHVAEKYGVSTATIDRVTKPLRGKYNIS